MEIKKSSGIFIQDMELPNLISMANKKIINTRFNKKGISGGKFLSKIKGRGMEFDESRLYQPGDDFRHIDWKVTAKSGKTHTKLFTEEKDRPVILVLDLSRSMFFGSQKRLKSVQAARTASLYGWRAIKSGDRVGAIIISENRYCEFRAKREKNYFLKMLNIFKIEHNHIVSNMNKGKWIFKNDFSLSHSLKRLRYLVQPGSIIYFFSDFSGYDEDCKKHFLHLSKYSHIKAILVTDPLENNINSRVAHAMSDGERITWFNSGNSQIKNLYSNSFKKYKSFLAAEFKLIKVSFLTVSTIDKNPLLGEIIL